MSTPGPHRTLALVLLLMAEAAGAAPATLSRDVGDYFALSFRRMRLKDFHVEAPGCNLGVDCQLKGRTCGVFHMTDAVVPPPGQIAGDDLCGPGSLFEVFRNNTSASCSPDCGMITNDGPEPHCVNTFATPLLGDLDNDGTPSCDANCQIDIGDVAKACDVPYPLPPCDFAKGVRVDNKSDCSPIEYDQVPGNGQCDLKVGTYGIIRVRNKGKIVFAEGTTVACMLAVGRATRVSNVGTSLVIVPGYGKAAFNNMADVGSDCRSFKVVTEYGPLRFGKMGESHLDACSLAGTVKLGHGNNLRGRFISGEFMGSNLNSTGACCEPTTTSTSTSTTTTSSSSSTTSTTNPDLPGICCEDTTEEPPLCGSALNVQDCLEAGGTPGPASSSCQAEPGGGGRCTDAPPTPGGCCQFENACAIGGNIDDVVCSSLGGAFVPNAICSPDGDCIPVSTSTTTVTTVTTVTFVSTTVTTVPTTVTTVPTTVTTSTLATSTTQPVTTSTLSSTTTSTTTPPPPPAEVCCDAIDQVPPLCGSAESEAACIASGGTPGPIASTCQANPGGGGSCVEGPPNPGGCCQFDGSCAIGGDIDEVTCASLGGAFVENAVCSPDGDCGPPTTSTTSTTTVTTLTTVTTISTTSTSSVTTVPTTSSSTVTSLATTSTSSSTSTTNTTAPAVCCENTSESPSTCNSAASAAACTASGGVVGPAGSVCQASPSGGVCDTGPPPPAGCCQTAGQCTIGGVTQEQCEAEGGTWVTDAQCLPDGRCVPVPPSGAFTRTLGFYKTHPGVTQWILDLAGGISVCGIELTNTDVDDSHSALEALCISPKGDQRLQLVRQLTAAALTMAAGGATFADFDACNALCATASGSIYDVGDCINSADNFNNSGDNLPAPFDGVESGYPEFCQMAHNTACNMLEPDTCSE